MKRRVWSWVWNFMVRASGSRARAPVCEAANLVEGKVIRSKLGCSEAVMSDRSSGSFVPLALSDDGVVDGSVGYVSGMKPISLSAEMNCARLDSMSRREGWLRKLSSHQKRRSRGCSL